MPYTARKVGDQYCVYKKDGGAKVGCTDGNKEALKKYLAALHINAKESVSAKQSKLDELKALIKKMVKEVLTESYDASQTTDLIDAIQLAYKEKGDSIRQFDVLEPYVAKLQFELYPGDLEIGPWSGNIANVLLQGKAITQLKK